jgi:hypothetical protein
MPATSYLSWPVPHSRSGPEDIPLRRFFPSSGSSFHCEGTLDQEGKTHKLREMHMDQLEILEQLKQLALKRSKPFCYSCYEEAPSGRCVFAVAEVPRDEKLFRDAYSPRWRQRLLCVQDLTSGEGTINEAKGQRSFMVQLRNK